MFECTYCKRILKKNYITCPGCGASSFQEKKYKYDFVIDVPPQGGYKINYDNFNKKKNIYKIFYWVGIGLIIVFALPIIPFLFTMIFLDFAFSFIFSLSFIIIPAIIAIPFILIGKNELKKIDYEIEKIKRLSKTGILIKNLNYDIVPTGTIVNNVPIYAIKVNYITKNGIEIPLVSEEKHDGQLSREDGTVDLLIDPNDNTNYYIDFEIY